jgi:hypothetical protein
MSGVRNVPRSQLRKAYELVLARWPDRIEAGDKTFHLGSSCNMRGLNETHRPIEAWATASDFEPEVDEIVGSVEHYVFATIHDALKNLTIVRKADLDFEAFASRFDSHPNFRVIPDAEH